MLEGIDFQCRTKKREGEGEGGRRGERGEGGRRGEDEPHCPAGNDALCQEHI